MHGADEEPSPRKYRAFLSKILKIAATGAGALAVADALKKSPRLRGFFMEAVEYGLWRARRIVFEMAWNSLLKFPSLFVKKSKKNNTKFELPPGFTSKSWSLLVGTLPSVPAEVLVYWLTNPGIWTVRPIRMLYKGGNPVAVRIMEHKVPLDEFHPHVVRSLELFTKKVYGK